MIFLFILLLVSNAEIFTGTKFRPTVTYVEDNIYRDTVIITNNRYTNEDVIWSRPKGLDYGNLPGSSISQKANLYPDKYCVYFVSKIYMKPG